MRREWEPEDLIACWTLVDDDWRLLANKRGPSRLAFGLCLKFFELEGRFPRHAGELPRQAVTYVAEQLHVDASALDDVPWVAGRLDTTAPRSAPRSGSESARSKMKIG